VKQIGTRIGVAIASGGARQWHYLMLECLGRTGIAVDLGEALLPEVPSPWGCLLPLERLFARPRPDLFAQTSIETVPLELAHADALVLSPGQRITDENLSRLPLGAFEIAPIHPSLMNHGVLEGRVLWRRAGSAPRLAASITTCLGGPLPLSWAGPHMAKMARLPAKLARRLALDVESFWDSCPEAEPLPLFSPGFGDWVRFFGGLAAFGLKRAWQDIFHRRQWHLAVRPGDGDPLRPGFATEPFTPVYPPKGLGWADPIVFAKDGRNWLFIEEIPGQGKGVLSVMEFLPGGVLGKPLRVLEEPFHLSYPMVFEHEGTVYMVPESAQAKQVRLYRATDFPRGWVLDRVLLDDVSATDATFLEHGGSWWMFVNIRAGGGSSWDELHLYRSESRFGPFEAHPLNPVVSDVRRARPAGPIIKRGGKLFRPAQDCSSWYGRALSMMEIVRLNESGYEEREATQLEPELIPGSFCLHTFESEGTLEIVDGQRRVPLWR